ncbi:hypothetical protein BG006_001011 [Podila minutissima]|uniref:F-box domain-containing protein n=1 Tax=Podila minutissima TaxID=64525 RepID=A0A9P5VNW2_9FUNG|nr:hypothetical protein BG006_001011 [Podila minutissima]
MSSLALRINPIEIPEVLLIVGCHLSTLELRNCMLVSKTWLQLFRTYYWHHLYFIRNLAPSLKTYGNLVRRLTTANLYDEDMRLISETYHLVQRLELELGVHPTTQGVDVLFESLPHIQELEFRTFSRYFETRYFAPITTLRRLSSLTLSRATVRDDTGCEFQALFNMLDNCHALRTLKLDGIIEMKESARPYHSHVGVGPGGGLRHADGSTIEPAIINNTHRPRSFWGQLLEKFKGPNPDNPEPWRKFTVLKVTPPPPLRVFEYAVDLFQKPDPTVLLQRLTKLSVSNISITNYGDDEAPLWYLFKKSPFLQELHVDFGRLRFQLVQKCLEAIGETCQDLVTLTLERVHSTESTRSWIQDFLHRPRRGLLNLRLMECRDVGSILEHIPSAVAVQLKNLSLKRMVLEHQHVHQLLMRCRSLESFAWTAPKGTVYAQPRLDLLVEPWACMETLRHLEHVHVCPDQDSLDALSNRMEQMPRLVTVGACIDQARISFAKGQEPGKCKKQDGKERMVKDCMCKDCNGKRDSQKDTDRKYVEDEKEDIEAKVMSDSVQELTIEAVPVPPSHILPGVLLKQAEIESMLKSYPKLRKIRYRGRTFPLYENVYRWLQAERPDISVIHVTQLPRFSVFED